MGTDDNGRGWRRAFGRSVSTCVVTLLALASASAPAQASEPIASFAASPSTTQAGGHPDLSASFALEEPGVTEVAKSAVLGLPAGLTAIPSSVTNCLATSFALDECTPNAQVGLATIHASYNGSSDALLGTAPVYALVAPSGRYGELGFVVPTTETHVTAPLSIRAASDYGLGAEIEGLDQSAPLAGLDLELWGVPASYSHDAARFPKGSPGHPAGCPGIEGTGCIGAPVPSSLELRPFTLNPTTCTSEHPAATLVLQTYADPGHTTLAQAALPATTGCDQLSFNPSLYSSPTTKEADSPSGLEISIVDPMSLSPNVPTPSELREVGVAFPYEMELNAESLEGHGVCTDAEAAIGVESAADCPDESLLGSFSMKLPYGTASGFAYLGEPEPDGTLRLLLIASGTGFEAKLVAYLELEPENELLVLWLEELPQLPIGEYDLHLFGGREALFVTPLYCEENKVESFFVPWDEGLSNQSAHLEFTLASGPGGAPCLGPAEHVQVALSPSSVPADGSSAVTATATVTDANGERVPWDELVFSSTDPGEKIGPVEAEGDGTYEARILASGAPGTATITATDRSVAPGIAGSAQLTQLGGAPPGGALPSAPRASIEKKPPYASRDRRPRFHFSADIVGSSFECRLDHRAFKPCDSPFTVSKLTPGKHRFQVRAIGPTGLAGPVADDSFVVLRSRRG